MDECLGVWSLLLPSLPSPSLSLSLAYSRARACSPGVRRMLLRSQQLVCCWHRKRRAGGGRPDVRGADNPARAIDLFTGSTLAVCQPVLSLSIFLLQQILSCRRRLRDRRHARCMPIVSSDSHLWLHGSALCLFAGETEYPLYFMNISVFAGTRRSPGWR